MTGRPLVQVADLVAEARRADKVDIDLPGRRGLSNEEIAERLRLVPGTVANPVEAILQRLGLRNRTQIGVWAVERGCTAPTGPTDGEPPARNTPAGPCTFARSRQPLVDELVVASSHVDRRVTEPSRL